MKKKTNAYEIAFNAQETWFFTVEASSTKEALARYKKHHESVFQTSTTGGWVAGKRSGAIRVTKIK